jgi:hypothetical protein
MPNNLPSLSALLLLARLHTPASGLVPGCGLA